MLLRLGYNGVIDNGGGIIHPSEPTQAVFFRISDLEHLESIRNRLDADADRRILPSKTPGQKPMPPGVMVDRGGTRIDNSVEALNIRSGVIPIDILIILGDTNWTNTSLMDHLDNIKLGIRASTDSSYEESYAVEPAVVLRDIATDEASKFEDYRKSLILFKHNAPDKYAEVRPRLVAAFEEYVEYLDRLLEELKSKDRRKHYRLTLAPVVTAFNKLLKAI